MSKVTTGHVVNLVSNDVERLIDAAISAPFLFTTPIQLAVVTWLLYRQVEVAAFVGAGFYVVVVPYHLWTSSLFKRFRSRVCNNSNNKRKKIKRRKEQMKKKNQQKYVRVVTTGNGKG